MKESLFPANFTELRGENLNRAGLFLKCNLKTYDVARQFRMNFSAQRFGSCFRYRQPNSAATGCFGMGLIHTVETVEKVLQFRACKLFAGVRYFYYNSAPFAYV